MQPVVELGLDLQRRPDLGLLLQPLLKVALLSLGQAGVLLAPDGVFVVARPVLALFATRIVICTTK